MEYGIIFFVIIGVYLIFIEIDKLKKQVKSQQKQIDTLCKQTGNVQLATYYLSEDDKEYILHLKNSGKETEAVKRVIDVTSMDLVQAKQYVDTL
ncbi:MAG: 50S ribosomal protein L7/L12 [Candidatus Ruminococcus intestinipullorum]|nr:50S ribosomal protein L7/L12 [Candidatus Ruminococcus intestinipullorum]